MFTLTVPCWNTDQKRYRLQMQGGGEQQRTDAWGILIKPSKLITMYNQSRVKSLPPNGYFNILLISIVCETCIWYVCHSVQMGARTTWWSKFSHSPSAWVPGVT